MEFIGLLIIGFVLGFVTGRNHTRKMTDEDMLRALVTSHAASRIHTITRERLEAEIEKAAQRVAEAKTAQ
jgi:hypothetical protein